MHLIRYLLFLCFIILSPKASGQAIENNSIVHLRTGSIFFGEILNIDGDVVQMRLLSGQEVSFSKWLVKKYLPADKILVFDKGKFHVTHGWFFNTDLGLNLGGIFDTENQLVSSHLHLIYGYNFNEKFSLAAGIGFEFHETEISGFRIDTQFNPLFLFGRYYFNENKKRLFTYGRVGYGFIGGEEEFQNDNNGGVQYQAGLGIHFATKKRSNFVLTVGYHLQKTDGTENFIDSLGNEIQTEYDIWIRRLMINFGIEFNQLRRSIR